MTRTMLTHEELLAEIQPLVADCLGCEPDEVVLTANFFHDLDGESIDIIDLTFRCERRLGVKVAFQRLQDTALWQFDSEGRLSPESLAAIRASFPDIDLSDLEHHSGPFHPHDFLTINRIVELIDHAQRQSGGVEFPSSSEVPANGSSAPMSPSVAVPSAL